MLVFWCRISIVYVKTRFRCRFRGSRDPDVCPKSESSFFDAGFLLSMSKLIFDADFRGLANRMCAQNPKSRFLANVKIWRFLFNLVNFDGLESDVFPKSQSSFFDAGFLLSMSKLVFDADFGGLANRM